MGPTDLTEPYPYRLLKKFDKYIGKIEEHNKLLDILLKDVANELDIIEDSINLNILNMLLKEIPDESGVYDPNKVESYRRLANYYIETDYIIYREIIRSNTEMREITNLITDFHHFFKENTLRIPERRFGLQASDVNV